MEKNNKRQSFKKTISQNKFFSVLLIFSLIFTSFTFFSGIKSVNALEKLKPISETDLIDYVDINYNNNDLDVNFINKTNKKLIGSMKLKSHKNVNEIIKVAPGWSVSMVYEININKKFENYLHEPIFIDMKTNEYINKDYKFVYWGSEERTRINYDEVCETIDINNSTKETNQTQSCSFIENGTETYIYTGWLDYNSKDIPKGKITIGLMTYNELGEIVDGIWDIGGKKLTKHAGWETSLETDLISYYELEETTGAVIDSHGTNDGTNNGATRGVTGKINNAFDFERDNTEKIDLPFGIEATQDALTISAWVKVESNPSGGYLSGIVGNTLLTSRSVELSIDSDGNIGWNIFTDSGRIGFYTSSTNIDDGSFHHIVLTYDDGTARLYIDNSLDREDSTSGGGDIIDNSNNFQIGYDSFDLDSNRYFDGIIDEVGIWSRTLTSTEVSTLYNSGSGIEYGVSDITPPIITTNEATEVSTNSAKINGNLDNLGSYSQGEVYFQYIKTSGII